MLDWPSSDEIDAAVDALRRGQVIVYPTETVYGLGADATNSAALAQLLALKEQRDGRPISVLIDSRGMLEQLAAHLTPLAERLMSRFWPGPLTLVVSARAAVSQLGVAGTIGVRWSSHPVATTLVTRLGRPLTAPSANPSGATPALSIAHARAYFGDRVGAYVDGGVCPAGVGSTVVDVTGDEPRVLREGAIPAAAVRAALTEAA